MNELRELRQANQLTLKQVAAPLGRSGEWLRRIENASLPASQETIDRILECISRCATAQKQALGLFTGMRIPPLVSRKRKTRALRGHRRKRNQTAA